MTHKIHSLDKAGTEADAPQGDERDAGQIVERPDGYYWQAPDSTVEFGPFENYDLALASREEANNGSAEAAETLQELERDVGINEWIDAETGEPAEGQSPPHLEEE